MIKNDDEHGLVETTSALLAHLRLSIEHHEWMANQLFKWANESISCGWSTHHVESMRRVAGSLRVNTAASKELIKIVEGQS